MSEASYFDDPKAAIALRKEALSWLGTPFTQYYQDQHEANRKLAEEAGILTQNHLELKGAGIDCIGLVQEIFLRIGATDKFLFKRDPSDYQSHQTGEKILDWMRGKADDPQSKTLAQILVELEIPAAVFDPDGETPRDFFKPGDILIMQHGSLFHMPVIYDSELHFVNALPRLGVIEGTIQDSTYSNHLVAAFRLKPKEKTP